MTFSVQLMTNTGLTTVTERVTELTATDEAGNALTFSAPYVSPVLSILAEARIHLDYSEAVNGAIVPNKSPLAGTTPTQNLIAFPTGPIVDSVANSNQKALTNFFQGTATRIVSSGTNRSFYLMRPSQLTPDLPAGTYSYRYRIAGTVGAGNGQIVTQLFPAGATATRTIDEISSASADVATEGQVFEGEINYAGSGDFILRLNADGTDILIDALQVHEGPLSSMPDWADERFGGGRKANAFTGSLSLDANGAADTATHTSGLYAIDPAFPQTHDYNEYTVLTVQSADYASALGCLINFHDGDGGTNGNMPLQMDNTAPYEGEINSSDGSTSRSAMSANMDGLGVFVASTSRSATQQKVFIQGARVSTNDVAFTGHQTSRWTLGSFATSDIDDLRNFRTPGKHVFTVIWDRELTDDEQFEVASHLSGIAASRGNAMADIASPMVISGDSNATKATGDWSQRLTAKDFFAPNPPLIAANTSIGGQGLSNLERLASSDEPENGLPEGTITENGRFYAHDLPALLTWAKLGLKPIYFIALTTNDGDRITDQGSVGAYMDDYEVIYDLALNAHPGISLLLETPKPQDTTRSDWANWETWRFDIRDRMLAYATANPGRVFINDMAVSPTIGSRSLQLSGTGGPHYVFDEIHLDPNAAAGEGDEAYANESKTVIEDVRTALGTA